MNQDGLPANDRPAGASPQGRVFRPELAREAEDVFRRGGSESLDDYLKNINAYLTDLNRRLTGEPEDRPQQEVPSVGDEAPVGASAEEEGIPFAVAAQPGAAPESGFVFMPPEQTEPMYEARNDLPPANDNAPAAQPEPPAYGPSYDTQALYAEPVYYGGPAPYAASAVHAEQAAYAEASSGYMGGDWQNAVPNPELYPDLDDPRVTGAHGRKKEKKARKAEQPVKTTKGGKSRFSFVTTVLNLAVYGVWTVLYFVCLTVRSMMFTGAQAEMASQGVTNYSVTISSPLFTVLKIMVYAMPVILLLWMRGVLSAEKRELPQINKKLLIAAFAVDLLVGFIVIFDVLAAKLIFG